MKKFMKWLVIIPLMFMVVTAEDCYRANQTEADAAMEDATEELTAEAFRQLGMPDIINFTERRFMKQILELRDRETVTHSYIKDLNGDLHYLCQSIGYGLPYSTQYTNPERLNRWASGGGATLPQPDPNGLFMPDGMAATWVLCLDPSDGDIDPLYVEPELIVSPFKLTAQGGDYYSAELQAEQETAGIQ